MRNVWTREALGDSVRAVLNGRRLIVVSNREPFQHRRVNGKIECNRPASGMATALDPVLRASGGLWIAHGSGDADRLTVDAFDHVRVPPDSPSYTLRRVWLTPDEEEGHYAGLSNQALWPLCHVAFTRPVFDPVHWETYRRVNRKFAQAVLEEAGDEPTVVFIQDYHFGLLPRMLKEAGANLVVAQFWHIPWPNADVFSSFPWRDELLDGLLGNDLLGFHLPHHCQNFLACVDSNLEARIDHAEHEVCRDGHATSIRPFPIGIDFAGHVKLAQSFGVRRSRDKWRSELHLRDGQMLGIGIDRLDYTKGIPERLRFLDYLFENYPEYRGKLTFVQIAVPSRASLPAYRQTEAEVEELTAHINFRWGRPQWQPIVLMKSHYESQDMIGLHQLADFCLVTSLHDGMNLVAKEFIASRTDEDGALILSEFAGAARELKDALLINPFSVEQGAAAIHSALTMPREERGRRMKKMREAVRHNNVYRWAGRFMNELTRVDATEGQEAPAAEGSNWKPRALGMAV
jgi:alpha,alpha-trehalose-phosphate synthase [UDP-forming]